MGAKSNGFRGFIASQKAYMTAQKPQWKKKTTELRAQIAKDKIRATKAPVVNMFEDAMEANQTMTLVFLMTMVFMTLVFGYKFPKTFMVTVMGVAVAGFMM